MKKEKTREHNNFCVILFVSDVATLEYNLWARDQTFRLGAVLYLIRFSNQRGINFNFVLHQISRAMLYPNLHFMNLNFKNHDSCTVFC